MEGNTGQPANNRPRRNKTESKHYYTRCHHLPTQRAIIHEHVTIRLEPFPSRRKMRGGKPGRHFSVLSTLPLAGLDLHFYYVTIFTHTWGSGRAGHCGGAHPRNSIAMNTIQYETAAYFLARWQEWQAKQQFTPEQKAERQEKSRRSNAHQITIQKAKEYATQHQYNLRYPHHN